MRESSQDKFLIKLHTPMHEPELDAPAAAGRMAGA